MKKSLITLAALSALGGAIVACNSGSSNNNQPKVTLTFSPSTCNLSTNPNESVALIMTRTNMPIESQVIYYISATTYINRTSTSTNTIIPGLTTESATKTLISMPCMMWPNGESGTVSMYESSTKLPTSNTAVLTITGRLPV